MKISRTRTRPRSGLGLNELLGAALDGRQYAFELSCSGHDLFLNSRDACEYCKVVVGKHAETIADPECLVDELGRRSEASTVYRVNA